MPFAVHLCHQHHIKAPLKGEILVDHLAYRLGFDFAAVLIDFRVVEEVDNHIIRQRVVDIVDEVAKCDRHVGVFLIANFLGAVKQFVDHEKLRVINDIAFQLGVFEDAVDLLISRSLADLVVALERQPPLFHGEDANLLRLESADGAGLAATAFPDD